MSHNTWIHRIVRVAVRPLRRTAVTPNQLTTARLVAGLAAAAAFAVGGAPWLHWGAGIFVLAVLLDRADGELARSSGRTSSWGHKYDLVSDAVSNAAAFFGLGIGLSSGSYGGWAPMMGLLAGVCVAAILWLILGIEARRGPRAGELGAAAGFDPDDAILLVPVAIWAGYAEELLVAATIGTPAFALFMLARLRGPFRTARPNGR